MSPRPGVLALVEILKSIREVAFGLLQYYLGGGFKYFLFSSLLGEGFQFD